MKFANSTLTANRGDHPSSTIAGGGKSTTERPGNYTTSEDATGISLRRFTRRFLGFVDPMLPTLVREPPAGDDWIHEFKHDGYPPILAIDRGQVRASTRNRNDVELSANRVHREKLAYKTAIVTVRSSPLGTRPATNKNRPRV